ncbi:MAG: hypothetical protein H7831_06740 [Magnetococcus sp. WYHC-3]
MKLYHITFTERIASIAKHGLLPFQTSNWVTTAGQRYSNGEIYACTNRHDAIKWAAKMDWDFNNKIGSGKITIIEFNSTDKWELDEADPISQIGNRGKWVKRFGQVPAKNITGHKVLTAKMLQILNKA